MSSGKGLPSHFWIRNNVRSILPGLKRKITRLLLSGPKSSFQMKVNFAFHLEIKVPESGGRVERHKIHVAWSPVLSSQRQWWFGICHVIYGVGPLCFLKSTVNAVIYQDILGHVMLPSANKFYENANFIFQQDIENLWGIVKRKMRETRPNNADDLRAAIKATWASITSEQCHRLIASMPRRIDAVINAKWGPTKYWVHRNEHTFQKPDIYV